MDIPQRERSASKRAVPADREFGGALLLGAGLAVAAGLTYLFNALMGRRLAPDDYATFGAFLAGLLALSGPVTALSGGAAMSAVRSGDARRPAWGLWTGGFAVAAGLVSLLPLAGEVKAAAWFVLAVAASLMLGWNRGLLVGLGRLGAVGGTMAAEGLARIALAAAFVAAGWRVAGAWAGLALGIAAAVPMTEALLPSRPPRHEQTGHPWVGSGAGPAMAGLLFLGLLQFADVIVIRLVHPHGAGPYVAASSLARVALFVQIPGSAYALRRAAVAGPRRTLGRALALALAPAGGAVVVLEAVPGSLLRATYGGRYGEAAGLLRVLAPAMLVTGIALVLINLAMGTGRTAWVWTVGVAGTAGLAVLASLGRHPSVEAAAMLFVHGVLLLIMIVHVLRLEARRRPAQGAILILNWRDTRHPQGGGSEVYVEQVARRLAAGGRPVTVFCAAHPNGPLEETVNGVRFLRRGSWRTVYLWGAIYHLLGRFGPHETVVDVQNAVPFFTTLYCRKPVVVLVHHVHREQWRMLFGGRLARAGWWVESKLAPRVYGHASYVAVSDATKRDLVSLGVDTSRITVVRNGSPEPDGIGPADVTKSADPSIVYLGRLVPHKRIELLFEAAANLRRVMPGLRVRVVGQGLWEENLRLAAIRLGVADIVSFEGFVDEAAKRRILAESWVLALPSVKEGWGLAVTEAAALGTPAVAFRVGGLEESVADGQSGILVERLTDFEQALGKVLSSAELRARMGAAARAHVAGFGWDEAAARWDGLLAARVVGQPQEAEMPLTRVAEGAGEVRYGEVLP